MTNHSKCGERESLVALVYDECDASERHRLEAHVHGCALCAAELQQLRATHTALAAWPVAEPDGPIVERLGSEIRPWRLVQPDHDEAHDRVGEPSRRVFSAWWAQAAAAVLVLGAMLAIANLDIRFGADGVIVRTGWQKPPIAGGTRSDSASTESVSAPFDQAQDRPWRADLVALERQLRTEFGARPLVEATARNTAIGSSRPENSPLGAAGPASPAAQANDDGQLLQRLRQLIDDSERRQQRKIDDIQRQQQRELALRVAQMVREFEAQRRVDLTRIEQGFGRLEGVTGQEAARQRELLNYLVRVSQRQ
ncbi:MAG: hypothetical protein HYS05_05915 [Acidobacteria bacterium]|nr:hypothetical protein [Acidobacteriota bacterium]